MTVFSPVRNRVLCRLTVAGPGTAPADEIRGDVQFLEDGEVLAELRSVLLRRLLPQPPLPKDEGGRIKEEKESSLASLGELQTRAREFLIAEVARALALSPADIDPQTNFMDLGFDSLLALQVQQVVETATEVTLPPTVLFEHSSIERLSAHLAEKYGEAIRRHLGSAGPAPASVLPPRVAAEEAAGRKLVAEVARLPPQPGGSLATSATSLLPPANDLAVIGLACRFPGAATPEQFWDNLRAGRVLLGEPPADRGNWGPGMRGGYLADVWDFDAGFFGLNEEEVRQMDPQQRLLLEVAWEAIERAGLHPAQLRGQRVGVFVAAATQDHIHLLQRSGLRPDRAG